MQTSSSVDYGYLRKLVFDFSQNVIDPSRDSLFDTRLNKLVRSQGLTSLEELVQHLKDNKNPLLERSIAEAMTINETSFFRDGRPFELLRTELLPRLIESRQHMRSLRLWSAACSTGQEAYSLAMLILEHFPQLSSWNIRIEGTDRCAEVVEKAQAGCYHRIEMNQGLPARFVVRYFDHEGENWTVKPEVRWMCNFRAANLCSSPLPFNRGMDSFDIIFLRNVLLYFSQEACKALLAGIHKVLAPDGMLFLGSSEQPANPSIWASVLAGGTCHFRPLPQSD